jgi:hypothetical protein
MKKEDFVLYGSRFVLRRFLSRKGDGITKVIVASGNLQ